MPDPAAPPAPRPPSVHVVPLDEAVFRALADGDLDAARGLTDVPLSGYLVELSPRRTWAMRAEQVSLGLAPADWVTGVVVDATTGQAVGLAGFHGPPDPDGLVEIGYSVDPAWRGRGVATAALRVLLDRAAAEPSVRTVRLSIAPGNTASERIAERAGFVRVGEQVDPDDGLELVWERPVTL